MGGKYIIYIAPTIFVYCTNREVRAEVNKLAPSAAVVVALKQILTENPIQTYIDLYCLAINHLNRISFDSPISIQVNSVRFKTDIIQVSPRLIAHSMGPFIENKRWMTVLNYANGVLQSIQKSKNNIFHFVTPFFSKIYAKIMYFTCLISSSGKLLLYLQQYTISQLALLAFIFTLPFVSTLHIFKNVVCATTPKHTPSIIYTERKLIEFLLSNIANHCSCLDLNRIVDVVFIVNQLWLRY